MCRWSMISYSGGETRLTKATNSFKNKITLRPNALIWFSSFHERQLGRDTGGHTHMFNNPNNAQFADDKAYLFEIGGNIGWSCLLHYFASGAVLFSAVGGGGAGFGADSLHHHK